MPKAWTQSESKRKAFVLEYLTNWRDSVAAYIAIYWENKTHNATTACASRLLNSAKVWELLEHFEKEIIDDKKEQFNEVLWKFEEIRDRCMQAKPVMVYDKQLKEYVHARDEDWNHMRTFDASSAISSNREKAKLLGLYEEHNKQKEQKVEVTNIDFWSLSPQKKEELRRQLLQE